MTDQDQEITLGTGRLLGLFFGLVIICALFFSLGFSLGRRSLPPTVSAAGTPATAQDAEAKPSPLKMETAVKPDCTTPGACPPGATKSTSDELTFYKAVEQSDPRPKLETAAASEAAAPQPAAKPGEPKPAATEMTKSASMGTGYMVQVAAVTKQEDADALVNALRRKNYPVFTTTAPSDKLYHVQVGPFADLKDAEGTRSKLVNDGYNPILKK